MYKIACRLFTLMFIMLPGPVLVSCEEQAGEDLYLNELELADLEFNELLILPCSPTSDDPVSVIEKICGTESEVILSFEGRLIGYKRYVNSLIMAPCSPRLDTTILGQLPAGSYQLVHTVIDNNHFISDSILVQDTIALLVRK